MRLFPAHNRRSRTKGIRAILIVEDEPLVAFDNEHALAQAGYSVAGTVDRYEHAVEAIAGGGIDLIVADIRLPGNANGVDVARYAHARNIPVLFSAGACPEEARPFAIGWIAKPYLPRDLVCAVQVVERQLSGGKAIDLPDAMTLFVGES